MNCAQFQQVLPGTEKGGRSAEQELHLQSCSVCSDLVSDLDFIAREARTLQASDEPSPRVWNSLEIALREEGLIRQPQRETVPMSSRRWRLGWMVPVAAAALVAFGVLLYRPTIVNQGEVAQSTAPRVFHTSSQVS